MGQPKRKQSKQRTRLRRAANKFELPQLSKDPSDGTLFFGGEMSEFILEIVCIVVGLVVLGLAYVRWL